MTLPHDHVGTPIVDLDPGAALILAGDVTGPAITNTVERIRNVNLAAGVGAPDAGDVLQFDGTDYVAAPVGTLAPVDTITVASASRIVDVDTTGMPGGTRIWVRSVEDVFTLNRTTAFVADGITIADALVGGGQWIRESPGRRRWLAQSDWFIDPAAGNDESTGLTSGTAVATVGELGRRWGTGLIDQVTDVTILSDVPDTDPLVIGVLLGKNGVLRFHGTPTTTVSGTVAAPVTIDPATGTPPSFTDAAITWAPEIGRRLRLTSGPNAGALSWAIKDLGAGAVRTATWHLIDLTTTPLDPFGTEISPAVGETFVVETLTRLPVLNIAYRTTGDRSGSQGFRAVSFDGLMCDTGVPASGQTAGEVYGQTSFIGCDYCFPTASFTTLILSQCRVRATNLSGSTAGINGGYASGRINAVLLEQLQLIGNVIAQGTTLARLNEQCTLLVFGGIGSGGAAVFDATDGIELRRGGMMSADAIIWSDASNTGYGLRIGSICLCQYVLATKPTITGTAGDTIVGGTLRTYAQIPFVNGTNAAALVEAA